MNIKNKKFRPAGVSSKPYQLFCKLMLLTSCAILYCIFKIIWPLINVVINQNVYRTKISRTKVSIALLKF